MRPQASAFQSDEKKGNSTSKTVQQSEILNQSLHDWQHKPVCLNRGLFRSKMYLTFEDLGVPDLIVQGMSKEGMRTAQPEQASVITPMLCRQSALVICPEAAEPLYFLRSSICAATLTIATTSVHAVQVVLLTPTDNLARALYRPLEGYARFSTLGARICRGPHGGITPPSSPIPGSVHSSPPSARGDGGLSARGLTNPQILVGTPEAVLAHLSSETAPPVAKSMLMAVCHAHDILDGCAYERQLVALMHCISASQVVVFTSQESHVAEQCDRLFPHLSRLYPYATARTASFDSSASSRIASQHSSGHHGVSHGSHCSSGDGCASPEVPWSPSGWAGTGWPWISGPSSSSAGELQGEGSAQGHADVHDQSMGGLGGSRGGSGLGVAVDAPLRRNMHTTILPAGYMPCKPQLSDKSPRMLPGTQLRRRVKAGGTDWVPVTRRSGFRGHEGSGCREPHPGSWRYGGGGGDPVGSSGGAVFDRATHAQLSLAVPHGTAVPVPGFHGRRAFLDGRMDARQGGPFPGFDESAGSGNCGVPLWPQPHTKGRVQEAAWGGCTPVDDERPPSGKAGRQPRTSKAVGRPEGQLTEQLGAAGVGRARPPSACPPQHELEQTPRRQTIGAGGAEVGREDGDGWSAGDAMVGSVEETPTLVTAERVATPATAAACGSLGSATTGCSSSMSFAAWTPSVGGASKPLAPNLGQHPWPLTMVTGTRDAAPPPPLRQCEVRVPSMREVAQLSAAVRRGLSLASGKGASEGARSVHECGDTVREGVRPPEMAAAERSSSEAPSSLSDHVAACAAALDQKLAGTAAGGADGSRATDPEVARAEAGIIGDAVVDSAAGDAAGVATDTSAALASETRPSCEMVRSPGGPQHEGQPVPENVLQRPRRSAAVGRELSADAIAEAREAAAQAVYAAEACVAADKRHEACIIHAQLPRDSSPLSWCSKSSAVSTPYASPAVEAGAALDGTCVGAGVLQQDASAGLQAAPAEEHCGTSQRYEPHGAKSAPAPQQDALHAIPSRGASAAAVGAAAVGAPEPRRAAWEAPTERAPHGRGSGLVVSTPPHFKSLPFSHHWPSPPKHRTAACRLRQPPQTTVVEPASGKSHESGIEGGSRFHDLGMAAGLLRPLAPGAAGAEMGVDTSSKEAASEAPAEKEHRGLEEDLLRVSSEDYSDFTVMAYTGGAEQSAAPSGGGDGGLHSGDEQSSTGGLASIAASPPLLEPCQTIQGKGRASSSSPVDCNDKWLHSDVDKHAPACLEAPPPPGPSAAPMGAPPTLAQERSACMLMHESIVIRQLRGAAPPPAASPAALSLVTAALERMAAADHTAMHARRPAADSFSRYEQACAALVAAPEAPPLAISGRRTNYHSAQHEAAMIDCPGARPMATSTGGVCGRATASARCTLQGGNRVTQQGRNLTDLSGAVVKDKPKPGVKAGGEVAQRAAAGGSVRSVADSPSVSGRYQMIEESSRQNFLRLFGQDDLDLAEDLAFSCAAFEDGSSCF